ncbi:hypothetical protein [Confluentibacter citreus]|uniref:hypothetical protein n=1 Tax=Confluentibacter citreus TaxID=2007307 RepID=UPI0012FDDF2C|nr:hypothetical protein [Confluentibacter citreus]
MRILRKIKEFKSKFSSTSELDNTFSFPYSANKLEKENQIWMNLQKGIFLEDKKILIPWNTPFNQLDNYKEIREDKGDRTEWYLGKHKILDGYESNLGISMWIFLPWTNPFERVTELLGFGIDGYKKSQTLINHLELILGKPTLIDIEFKNEKFFEGSYKWQNNGVKIEIIGFDMHGSRYLLNIGLVKNKNEEFLR